MKGSHSLEKGLRFYDYDVDRLYFKGDDLLFRPLSFCWLALLNHFFAWHYVGWNLANLGIHLLVVILLYELFQQIQPGIFSGLFALLFAVMRPPIEMVVWNHIGGYLWGCAFFLLALTMVWRILRVLMGSEKEAGIAPRAFGNRELFLYAISMTFASFCYEPMPLFALLILGYLFFVYKKAGKVFPLKSVLCWASPLILYGLAYLHHCRRVPQIFSMDWVKKNLGSEGGRLSSTFVHFGKTFFHWIFHIATPTLLSFDFNPKEGFISAPTSLHAPEFSTIFIINLVILVGILWVIFHGIFRQYPARRWSFAVLLSILIPAYTALMSIYRDYTDKSYYLYLFCLAVLILSYSLVDWSFFSGNTRVFAAAFLAGFILLNAYLSYSVCLGIGIHYHAMDRFFSKINRTLDQHRDDPSFTFGIRSSDPQVNAGLQIPRGYRNIPSPKYETIPILQMIYGGKFNPQNPTLWISFGDGAEEKTRM